MRLEISATIRFNENASVKLFSKDKAPSAIQSIPSFLTPIEKMQIITKDFLLITATHLRLKYRILVEILDTTHFLLHTCNKAPLTRSKKTILETNVKGLLRRIDPILTHLKALHNDNSYDPIRPWINHGINQSVLIGKNFRELSKTSALVSL